MDISAAARASASKQSPHVILTPELPVVNKSSWREGVSGLIAAGGYENALEHLTSAIVSIGTITDDDVASICQQVPERDRGSWEKLLLDRSRQADKDREAIVESYPLCQKADKDRAATANHILGVQYFQVYDWPEARKYFQKAAKLGSPAGMNSAGLMCVDPKGLDEPNFLIAMRHFNNATQANNTSAMNNLGYLYEHGKGVIKNLSTARQCYRNAASQGDSLGMYNLGRTYFEDAKPDYELAFAYFKMAANAGHILAMNALGNMFANGQGTQQDYVQASSYYTMAAEAGHVPAIYSLGDMYGLGLGVRQDYAIALSYFRRAADAGHALAMNNLGSMYAQGLGISKDYAIARNYFSKAIDKGNVRAMSNLGRIYAQGLGVGQDYAIASKYFTKAISKGDLMAHFDLGCLYYHGGPGVVRDRAKAFECFDKSAGVLGPEQQKYVASLPKHEQDVEVTLATVSNAVLAIVLDEEEPKNSQVAQ
jgi:TPR repeat protein